MQKALRGVAVCTAMAFFSTIHAQAAPGDATRLEYARSEQAATCPDRTALKAAVSRRLGYDPFFPAARQAIVVEIVDVADELHARMRLIDEKGMIVGSRELRERVEHCEELVASLALAISIALDPHAALGETHTVVEEPPPAEPASDEVAAPAKSGPEPAADSDEKERPPKQRRPRRPTTGAAVVNRERVHLSARSALFADIGNAPALAFGFRVGLDLQDNSFRLGAEFSQQFPASKSIADGGTAKASLLTGALIPCFSRRSYAACGTLTLGALRTRGESIPNAAAQSTFYAAVGARFEYTPTLFRTLQLLTQVDTAKPLLPVSLHAAGAEVWHTPLFTVAASVGLRVRFY